MDDGSSDESLQIAELYVAKYPDIIRVFTHPGGVHRGISATANLAIRESEGEYWSGLPSDDVFQADKVKRQIAYLEDHPEIEFVYGHSGIIDAAGNVRPGMLGRDISSDANPLRKLILGNPIPGLTVLARRWCLEESGLLDETLVYSDWHLWIRMLARFRVGFLDGILANSRFHSYNTGTAIDPIRHLTHKIQVMKALLQGLDSIGGAFAQIETRKSYERLIRANISRYNLALAMLHASRAQKRPTRMYLTESVRGFPFTSLTKYDELRTVLSQLIVPGIQGLLRSTSPESLRLDDSFVRR